MGSPWLLKSRTVLVPTAGLPVVEVIAGPGKDARWEGREGRRKQGNSPDCDSVQTFPGV